MSSQHFEDEYDDEDNVMPNRNTEAIAVARNIQFEAQKLFYMRFAQFVFVMTVFFILVMFSDFKNGSFFMILLTVAFGVLLLYMLGSLVMTIYIQNQLFQPGILTEGGMNNIRDEEDEDENVQNEQRLQSYTFEETPYRIRQCQSKIGFAHPTNGLYKVVYSAIYFGKTIRTEAKLELKFEEASQGNGWKIQGTSISGTQAPDGNRIVSEGFVNPRGEMYWKLTNPLGSEQDDMSCTYRGILDFQDNTMFDGEFEAEKVPRGRIVRMELQTADPAANGMIQEGGPGDDEVEMVELGKGWD